MEQATSAFRSLSSGTRIRSRLDRRAVGVGAGSGLIAICCLGSAIAVGASIGGLSFFTTWMDRYQPLFVAGGIVAMLLWLARLWRRDNLSGPSRWRAARVLLRHAAAMGLVSGLTLAFAVGAAAAAGAL